MALVAVVMLLAILAILAASAGAMTTEHRRAVERYAEATQANALNDSAIRLTLLHFLQGPSASRKQLVQLRTPYGYEIFGQDVRVTVTQEYGRLDLNTADPDLLLALFRTSGLQEESARDLIEAIRRRRAGSQTDAGTKPSSSFFESISEIRALPGGNALTDDAYDSLTVYTKSPGAVEALAQPAARRALSWAQDNLLGGHPWLSGSTAPLDSNVQGMQSPEGPVRVTSCTGTTNQHCRTAIARLSGLGSTFAEVFFWGPSPP